MKQNFKLSPNKGFTLIELLIVIAIIGILSAIVAFSLMGTQAKARDGQRKADLAKIQSALELFRSDKGHYPGSDSSDTDPFPSVDCTLGTSLIFDSTTYLQTIPCDPLKAIGYIYSATKDGTNPCDNSTVTGGTGLCANYSLTACMETTGGARTSNCNNRSWSTKEFTVNNP